ncbi:type II toxin-antitoxin system VapC family toxin [Corynebacterium terpenotabidum]|uniref:Ribonuclease VapC n=1 Tax=Corynebacterium terpenotabidum Y-11 TaxID=1200352 RepID=S4X9T6_9CORY|nr:type II toxin-antitoxin system VapC family toxin [Corynebacterium terpenotabidum]AGP29882.1 PilT protein domain-containing protein [Corynebacterium terpenotabidum Y-11]
MIVLDASAAIELLVAGPHAAEARSRAEQADWQVMAPQLLAVEVLQVLRRRVRADLTTASVAEEARALLPWMRIRYVDHDQLTDRIWELRNNFSAYEAAYVAVAEALDVELLTGDARLADTPGHQVRVTVLGS